jgi:Berberine and berberine like
MRGGGAGSWGVIIDATFRTFPIFNATAHKVIILTATLDQTVNLMTTHAIHVKDWDAVRGGQYFILIGSTSNSTLSLSTFFKDLDGDASRAQMSSFLNDARALGAVVLGESTVTAPANDLVTVEDDPSGVNIIVSSRLIPNSVYLDAPSDVGNALKQLLLLGVREILGTIAAGVFRSPFSARIATLIVHVGQVAANANISSAIIPAWRETKVHVSPTPSVWFEPDSDTSG